MKERPQVTTYALFFQKVATAFITTCNNTSSILDSEKSRKSFCLIMESDKLQQKKFLDCVLLIVLFGWSSFFCRCPFCPKGSKAGLNGRKKKQEKKKKIKCQSWTEKREEIVQIFLLNAILHYCTNLIYEVHGGHFSLISCTTSFWALLK